MKKKKRESKIKGCTPGLNCKLDIDKSMTMLVGTGYLPVW